MIHRAELPTSLVQAGTVFKPVIGGHLENKPFLTQIDVTKNGWANGIGNYAERQLIIEEAKRRGLKYRQLSVLPHGLRGKKDLHGIPYVGSKWVLVEVRKE